MTNQQLNKLATHYLVAYVTCTDNCSGTIDFTNAISIMCKHAGYREDQILENIEAYGSDMFALRTISYQTGHHLDFGARIKDQNSGLNRKIQAVSIYKMKEQAIHHEVM